MKPRPPKRALSPEQEHAATAFVEAAEPSAVARPSKTAPRSPKPSAADFPWHAPYVRDDVMKGYALRLPEPLYLKLKWVAEQTGRSINTVCREAIEADVEAQLARRGT